MPYVATHEYLCTILCNNLAKSSEIDSLISVQLISVQLNSLISVQLNLDKKKLILIIYINNLHLLRIYFEDDITDYVYNKHLFQYSM